MRFRSARRYLPRGTAALAALLAALVCGGAAPARAAEELILVTNTRESTLSVISRETGKVIRTLPAGPKANSLALSPDNRHVYVINDRRSEVRIFDAHELRFVKSVRAGRDPYNLAFSPDGKYAYFVNTYSDNVTTLEVATGRLLGLIEHGGDNPGNIKVSPDGKLAYVANELSEDVSVVDLAARKPIKQIEAGHYIEGLDFSRDGSGSIS